MRITPSRYSMHKVSPVIDSVVVKIDETNVLFNTPCTIWHGKNGITIRGNGQYAYRVPKSRVKIVAFVGKDLTDGVGMIKGSVYRNVVSDSWNTLEGIV